MRSLLCYSPSLLLLIATAALAGDEAVPFSEPLLPLPEKVAAQPMDEGGDPVPTSSPRAPAPPADFSAQLQKLQRELDGLKQSEAERQAKDDAADKRRDDVPSFRISPELQLDNYYFGQNTESRTTIGNIPDGAAFRRARIAVLGDYKITEYRLEMDFAQPGRPSFLDVWGAINELPVVGQLKIGNFFEPIGLERLTSNRFAPFLERNLPDQPYDPQRNPGIAVQNMWGDKQGVWTLGVFRPRIDNFDDAVSDSGDWAYDGRFTWMPWYDEESGGRYYMHLGTAHSYRRTTNRTILFRAQPEARLGASEPNVPFFIDTGNIAALDYQLHEIEFAWSIGSLYLQAEYYWVPVGQINGPSLLFTGCYAQVGYFFTGEHRPFRRETATFDRVKPHTEFFRVRTNSGVAKGWGAWEIATRISHADLTDANIGGGRLTDLTVGLNWYLTPYMRLQSNYIHAFLDPATAGRTGADIFGMRMQYDF